MVASCKQLVTGTAGRVWPWARCSGRFLTPASRREGSQVRESATQLPLHQRHFWGKTLYKHYFKPQRHPANYILFSLFSAAALRLTQAVSLLMEPSPDCGRAPYLERILMCGEQSSQLPGDRR